MTSFTSYAQKKLQDHMLGLAAYTMPTTVYASLHTTNPTDAGSLAGEITTSGSGYIRVAITSLMNATDSVTGISANNATILFGPALVDWGTVSFVAYSDAITGGNMLMYGPLTEVQTTPIGESVQFSTGQFVSQLS
jgi:hypothetical protein